MENRYPHLFEPLEIRGRTLKNRIMSAPNMLFQVVNGRPTDYYVGYLEHKAKGGAAIVNLGEVPICDGGSHTPQILLTDENRNIFGEMSDAMKQHGALASAELTHGGRCARPWYNQKQIMGPVTEITDRGTYVVAMTEKDMDDIANAYADACVYLMETGFDMALIHAAHSWLFTQFLSPIVNTRTDEYGGSLENRMRFPLMCLKRMRERVGNGLILAMRLSGSERNPDGFTPEDIAEFLSKAEEYIDFVEISTEGWSFCMPSTYIPYCTNVPFSEIIKKSGKVHIPVFVLGSIMTADMAEEIIASGKADGVSLSRALIADPCMPNKIKAGKADEVVPCLRCLHCTDNDNARRFFECSVNPTTAHETRLGFMEDRQPAKFKKKVLVIGGGPAGIMAACTAAERGHEVTLCEKENYLGGTIHYAAGDPMKPDLDRYQAYIARRAEKADITVKLNTEVTPALVEELQPDHVIVATGSRPVVPKFLKGYEKSHHVLDMYFHPETVKGDKVVIIGGGLSGVEAAIYLAHQGKKVTVLEMLTCLSGVGTTYGWGVMKMVNELGVELINGAKVTEITDTGVNYTKDGAECCAEADSVFYGVGQRCDRELYYAIAQKAPFVDLVGDCRKVGLVGDAVHNGYFAALDIGSF